MDGIFWAMVGVSAIAAASYGLFCLNLAPSLWRGGLKTLFMAPLALALWLAHAPLLLVVAAAASALGDFFLAFDKKWVLPLGILAFLVAQISYCLLFHQLTPAAADTPLWLRAGGIAIVVTVSAVLLITLTPKLGALAVGVVPYSLAITAMGVLAMLLPAQGWPVMAGAFSFLLSDATLSFELFKFAPDAPERRVTGPIVWWSYAAAQALIVWGVLRLV